MTLSVSNLIKQPAFEKIDGKYKVNKFPKKVNVFYLNKVAEYLTEFDKLFSKAKEVSDFQFILSLLRVRGIERSDEDVYENTVKTFDYISKLLKSQKDNDLKLNIFLWLYGHIVEASEPYEIITNLINIAKGNYFSAYNFPKVKNGRYYNEQHPYEKITHIERSVKETEFENIARILNELYDRELRNSIFHSNYAVSSGNVFLKGLNFPKILTNEEITEKINCALAYHEVINKLCVTYTRGYDTTQVIPVSKSFSNLPRENAVTIIRKGHGVIGMKNSIGSPSQWYLGKAHGYESKLIDKGIYELPPDRVKTGNKILERLPEAIRKCVVKYIENNVVNKDIDDSKLSKIKGLRNKVEELYGKLDKIYSLDFEKYEKHEVKNSGENFAYSIDFDGGNKEENYGSVIGFLTELINYVDIVTREGCSMGLKLISPELELVRKVVKKDKSVKINDVHTALISYPTHGEISYGVDKTNMSKVNNLAIAINFVVEEGDNKFKGLDLIDKSLKELETYTNRLIGRIASK